MTRAAAHPNAPPPAMEVLERYREIVPDYARFVETNLAPEPVNLRIRASRIAPDEVERRLMEQGFELAPVPGLPTLRTVVRAPHAPAQTVEHWLGHIHIQQAVMAIPSLALDPKPGERVLDLCAAPGGKTSHLAELMNEQGCLVAVDPKEKRLRGLMANLFRMGHTNVLVVASDGRELPRGARFDRVLVDAPCSAEGNFRRQRGRLPRQRSAFGRYVQNLQRSLLRRAVELTVPGGTVVYSTCTWAPEENERVVADALRDLPVAIEPIPLNLPHAPGLTAWEGETFPPEMVHAWRLYPEHLDSGGAFVVRLRRLDDPRADSGDDSRNDSGADSRADPRADSGDPDAGWSSIPHVYPGEPEGAARARIEEATALMAERFGWHPGASETRGLGWFVRNENIWVETAGRWPVDGWKRHGGWRVVSLGLRAFRQGADGRESPSNAFLTRFQTELAGGVVPVTDDELRRLLLGERTGAPSTPDAPSGPVAVSWRGEVLGRAIRGGAGLDLQIPRTQAVRLQALLGMTPG
jgi:NOL1/NOP2/sun family putative RNA methylase